MISTQCPDCSTHVPKTIMSWQWVKLRFINRVKWSNFVEENLIYCTHNQWTHITKLLIMWSCGFARKASLDVYLCSKLLSTAFSWKSTRLSLEVFHTQETCDKVSYVPLSDMIGSIWLVGICMYISTYFSKNITSTKIKLIAI